MDFNCLRRVTDYTKDYPWLVS